MQKKNGMGPHLKLVQKLNYPKRIIIVIIIVALCSLGEATLAVCVHNINSDNSRGGEHS